MTLKNIKFSAASAFIALALFSCGLKKQDTGNSATTAPVPLVNPALPGDNPDPSIIRVGKVYYATSTTNEWAPYFTIYKSTNLRDWKLVNHVFPGGFKDMKDQWGENNFWASELAYDAKQNRIYAYYTAHNRKVNGNPGLQCGIAWIDADEIETGKFTDNGPVIIEDDCGAIDAFEFQDNGKIYAFWKNDGNGCGKESWIWVQEINESRTKLLGTKRKVYTNSQPWETALVEGACFFRLGEYVYSLYAVGGCCDANCNYKTGIARTRNLAEGKWEKYEKNPVMVSNDRWRCPGHGTVVQSADNRLFMLYHAFNKEYDVFVGREGIIEELKMGADGWPVLHNATVANRPKQELDFYNDFRKDNQLSLVWQWPSKLQKPQMSFDKGLHLTAGNDNHELGTFLGQYIKTVNFDITAEVEVTGATAGVCLGGAIFESKWPGELGGIGIAASKQGFVVFNNLNKKYEVLKQSNESLSGTIDLKMQISNNGKFIDFFYKNQESDWVKLYSTDFNASRYAPWGMGYRAGIVAKGTGEQAIFRHFGLKNN
ncbi:glycoside hydrolase family 43 protein [Pedobacter faecalis]|uniref:glycoside hydrolase family 43 protein n=1 Tax=Pedobacter faecalis TaxID=3041495 RepID=UPI00254A59FF|nr:glycoside hydrolase family 43 protein [Pedobacter sp. ELA7]